MSEAVGEYFEEGGGESIYAGEKPYHAHPVPYIYEENRTVWIIYE